MGQEMNIVGSQESSALIGSAPYYDRCASIVCSSDVSMRVHFLVLVAVDTLSLFRNLLEQAFDWVGLVRIDWTRHFGNPSYSSSFVVQKPQKEIKETINRRGTFKNSRGNGILLIVCFV